MTGTELTQSILGVETYITGAYLVFVILSAWTLRESLFLVFPQIPFFKYLAFGILLVFWAIITTQVGMDQNLFALEIALCLIMSVLHPAFAIGNFLVFIFLRPWEAIPSGHSFYEILPRMLMAIAVASSLYYLKRTQQTTFRLGPPYPGLFLFVIWTFLSTFQSDNSAQAQSMYFDVFLKSFLIFVIITQVIRDEMGLLVIKASLVFAGLGISIISLFRAMTSDLETRVGSFGLLADPNDVSAVMVMVFPLALYLIKNKSSAPYLKMVCSLTLLVSMVLFYYAKSRGATLSMLVVFSSMAVYYVKNKKAAIISGLLVFALFVPISSLFKRDSSDLKASTDSRVIYWKTASIMAIHSPVFGVGYEGYPQNFERYAPEFIESGVRTAHSSWFLVLAETGFPGLAFFASVFFWAVISSWKTRLEHPDVLFSTLGYGTAMSFLSHSYAIYLYVLLGIIFVTAYLPKKMTALAALLFCALLGSPRVFAESLPIQVEAVRGSDKPVGGFSPITGSKLQLSGSRGEVLNFQVKLLSKECVKISALGLENKSEIHLYRMPYFRTQNASFPGAYVGSQHDPLIPLNASDSVCPISNSKGEIYWSWIWGELKINREQPPGAFSPHLEFQSTSTEHKAEIPIQLRIYKMIMPEEPAVKLYSEYSSWYGVLGHFGKTNPREKELLTLYTHEMREHRISPIKSWVSIPTSLDTKNEFLDLVIRPSQPWEWIDFPKPQATSEKEQETYWRDAEQIIKDQNLKNRALVYLWDEPQKKDYASVIALSKKIKTWAPDLKILVTSSAKVFENSVDVFVPLLNFWGPEETKLLHSNHKVWTYVSCMSHGCQGPEESGLPDWVIDRPSIWVRSMAWIATQMGIDTYLYYNVDYAYQFYPKKDVWNDQWYFTGNGDGTLFYPGRPGGEYQLKDHAPIDSIRLKVWRESSFDAEYLNWMKKSKAKPKDWQARLNQLVGDSKNWSKNYEDYQELRDEAADFLDRQKN